MTVGNVSPALQLTCVSNTQPVQVAYPYPVWMTIHGAYPVWMITHGQPRIVKPKTKIFTLLISYVFRLPLTHQKSLGDPNWNPTMADEYDSYIKNKTWTLVPKPLRVYIISSMWFLSKNIMQMKHLLVTKRERLHMGKHKMLESFLMRHSVQWSCPPSIRIVLK